MKRGIGLFAFFLLAVNHYVAVAHRPHDDSPLAIFDKIKKFGKSIEDVGDTVAHDFNPDDFWPAIAATPSHELDNVSRAPIGKASTPLQRVTVTSPTKRAKASSHIRPVINMKITSRSSSHLPSGVLLRSSPRSTAASRKSSFLIRPSIKVTPSAKPALSTFNVLETSSAPSISVPPSVTVSSSKAVLSSATTTATPQSSSSLATLPSRMATALQLGDDGIVTEKELLSAIPNALDSRLSLSYQLLPDDLSITWLLNPNTAFVKNPGTLQNILFANKNLGTGDFPNNSSLAAAGSAPGVDTRMAYLGGNPFVTDDGGTFNWRPVSDPGMQAFDTNLVSWLLGLPISTPLPPSSRRRRQRDSIGADVSIVLAGLLDAAESSTRTAISQLFPNAVINNGKVGDDACDFSGSDNSCLTDADLLIVGDNRNPGDDTVANAVVNAYRNGLPLLIMTEDGNYAPDSWKIAEQLGLTLGQNFFEGQKSIVNSPKSYQAPSVIISDGFRAGVLQVVSYLSNNPLQPSDYAVCLAADDVLTGTIRMGDCVKTPPVGVTAHALPFFNAIQTLQNSINSITANGLDMFKVSNGLNTETLRLLTLLANKFRAGPRISTDTAVAIKYPIDTRTDGVAVTRALFADWVVPMSTSSTPQASDLGSLWCPDGNAYEVGSCTAPSFPDFGSYQLMLNSTIADEWTSTGFTQVPGRAATITLNNDPGIPIAVRTYAIRNSNSRTAEYNAAGQPLYNRPQFPVGTWIALKPEVPVTVNSPYGGPLYVNLDGSSLTSPKQASITFSNVSQHFSVLNASNDALTRLAEDLETSSAYWVDIVGSGFELHVPAAKLVQSLSSEGLDVGVGRKIYYNTSTSGLGQLMIDYKESWAEREYRMAGLKIDGTTLSTSLPAEVQNICQYLKWNCLDETIHRVTEVQHLTYDAYAACGQLCSGNPITASTVPAPVGWGEGHELGHNLQRQTLNIYWPDTLQGTQLGAINNWPRYSLRSTEVSNNIFPYFNQWTYFRLTLPSRFGIGIDNDPLQRHDVEDMTRLFSAHQSAYSNLQRNGQQVILDENCQTLDAFPLGTRPDIMLADAVWSNNSYAADNPERLSFYFALPQILQDKPLANGQLLTDGRNIYTLLYLSARLFSAYTTNSDTWQANAASLGFSSFTYSNDDVYGEGATVGDMIGNDFMVVTLSLLTGFDFRPYFTAHGVFYTTLADDQVTANAPLGGYATLGSLLPVLGTQYPKTNLSITTVGGPGAYLIHDVGIDLGDATMAWPGADNNNDGTPEDLVGFHPRDCPGVTVDT